MKVCIATEGGKNIGLGHITRCTSIYQAFEEIGIQPEIIVNGDKIVHDLLRDKNCKVFDWLDDHEKLFAVLRDADIAFVDSHLADYNVYEKISNIVETTAFFDDDMRIKYPKGFVINGAIFAEQMSYPKREDVTYLLGVQYTPLRREFWDVPEKSIHENLEVVMIVFGGADIRNLTPKMLGMLQDAYPELLKKVVVGKGFRNTTEIEKLKGDNTELIYYPDAAGMKKVMLESDVAISAGGQTLYELARVGVPTIAVCAADNQSTNIHGWQESGFAEYAGDGADENLTASINRKIELLKDNNTRRCKSKIGRKIINGAGSSRIVKEVLCDVYKGWLVLRKATEADAEGLLNLANEDIVRRDSFSHGKIKWADHIQWLNEKLDDNNCLFLIVDCSDKFAGQVRFDVISAKEEAIISIGLEKSIRGLGLSPLVINESIEKLMKVYKDLHLVRAYVKDGNITSTRAFERANFKFSKSTIVNGCKAMVYERVVSDG